MGRKARRTTERGDLETLLEAAPFASEEERAGWRLSLGLLFDPRAALRLPDGYRKGAVQRLRAELESRVMGGEAGKLEKLGIVLRGDRIEYSQHEDIRFTRHVA